MSFISKKFLKKWRGERELGFGGKINGLSDIKYKSIAKSYYLTVTILYILMLNMLFIEKKIIFFINLLMHL